MPEFLMRGNHRWDVSTANTREMGLVVSGFAPVLRGKAGRNSGAKIDHDPAKMG